jgi:hypothetical protein
LTPPTLKVTLGGVSFFVGGCRFNINMNKTYLWLAGMLFLGTVVGVAGAAMVAKNQAAPSPAGSATPT